jgi:hypothetical protein
MDHNSRLVTAAHYYSSRYCSVTTVVATTVACLGLGIQGVVVYKSHPLVTSIIVCLVGF